MTAPKFTPGPWALGNENNEHAEVVVGQTTISFCRHDMHTGDICVSREEMLANAHLAIAAPDLYAALSSWVKGLAVCGTCGAGRPTSATSDGVEAAREMGAHYCVECANWVRSNAALRKARGES